MKVIIVRPCGYSGGSLILETMCNLLQKRGVNASLFYIDKEPGADTKAIVFWWNWLLYNCKWELFNVLCRFFPHIKSARLQAWSPIVLSPVGRVRKKRLPFFSKKDTIVIYPEKIYGNFLKAERVVRYLLYYYPFENTPGAYGRDDLFVAYREVFNSNRLNPTNKVVTLGFFDNKLYRQFNYGPRQGCCYIVRKGRNREDLPASFDGPIIDLLPEEEKVRILNESERCYSYDTQTFYTAIAAVCGCLPIVVPEPGKTVNDYYGIGEEPFGVAFGDSPEEIKRARISRDACISSLDYADRNEKNITTFLSLLEEEFGLS